MALTDDQMRIYRRMRDEGKTASLALELTRYADHAPAYPWLAGLPHAETVKGFIGPFTVVVRVVPDDDARLGDDDVTGTFTDDADDDTIENTYRYNGDGNGGDWKFYRPSTYTRENVRAEYAAQGMSHGQIEHAYRARVRQEMRDDHMRETFGIIVDVYVAERHVGNASLWGIDTVPSYERLFPAHVRDEAENLISEAMDQGRATLANEAAYARRQADALEAAMTPAVSLIKQ